MRDGTKKAGARRGRPRLYDPEQALDAALEVFWMRGLTGTSLDHLVEATGMNRPSLYNAFGDKEAIYRQSLARFTAGLQEQLGSLLEQSAPVQEVVERFYLAALDVYCAGDPAPGCFVMCTAPVETAGHPEVREDLRRVMTVIDDALTRCLLAAQERREFPADRDARTSARLLQAVLHSLALRARAGESKAALRKLARAAVAALLELDATRPAGNSPRR